MPDRIEPCLALLKPKPPRGEQWVYEIKWDGYRLAVHIEPQRVRIITRGGHDWTHRFPAIERAAKQLDVATAILDGEAIVVDERGRSDFGLLQQSLGGRGGKRTSGEALFVAFDLLYFDGHDLRQLELSSRRHLLEGLIIDRGGVIRLSEEFEADGDRLLELACEHGLEGIIAKDRRSEYRSGRLGDWVICLPRRLLRTSSPASRKDIITESTPRAAQHYRYRCGPLQWPPAPMLVK
jgi:bifunctional non-homologous end joining protein LigD